MILKIIRNTKKSLNTDINGHEKKTIKYFFFIYITPLLAGLIIYLNFDKKFIDTPTIFSSLLSLFIGLIFGVLMKIPDKLSELKVDEENDTIETITKKNQAFNFLTNFRDFLSFTILLVILIILLIVISNFFPGLTTINLCHYMKIKSFKDIFYAPTYSFILIIYRFILVWGIINFLYFLILTIGNLYEFLLYEFKKNI